MKRIILLSIILTVGCIVAKVSSDLSVEWVGSPVITKMEIDGTGVTNKTHDAVEIGFRSDGVVVWRSK